MRELVVHQASTAECFTVSSGGSDGPSTASNKAWLGGGSSAQRRGSITAVDLDTSTITTQVPTALGTECFSVQVFVDTDK